MRISDWSSDVCSSDLATVVDDQLLDRRLQTNLDTGFQCGMQHLPLQRLACGRALLAAQLVLERTAEDAEQDYLGGLVALHQRQLHRFVEMSGQRQEAPRQLHLTRDELHYVEQYRITVAARARTDCN